MLAVAFFYRFGEGFIEKFGPLFMPDPRSAGGLGLDNQALGTIAFIVGAFLGGFAIARMTLRRSLFLLAPTLNLPHVAYVYLRHALPCVACNFGWPGGAGQSAAELHCLSPDLVDIGERRDIRRNRSRRARPRPATFEQHALQVDSARMI